MTYSKKWTTAAVSALLAALVAAVVMVNGNGGARAYADSAPTVSDRFPGSFDRPRTTDDDLPPSAAARLQPGGDASFLGVDAGASRLVAAAGGVDVYLVRGGGNACAVTSQPGAYWSIACGAERELANGGGGIVATQVSDPGQVRVVGLVGEGATGARVGLADGTWVPATVNGGVAVAETTGVPVSLTWSAGDGSVHRETAKALPGR